MDAVGFWISEYVLQSVLHGLIAALAVELLFYVWGERRPEVRLRFLLLVLLVSVLSFPLFQLLNPLRSTVQFRSGVALFDSTGWLQLRLFGGILLWHVALGVLVIFSLIFLIQDAMPIMFPYFHRKVRRTPYEPGQSPALDVALERLRERGVAPPPIFVLPVCEPLLYTNGIRRGAINVSQPLIESLDPEELEGVLAHELAHIGRRDNMIGWVLAVLRFLLVFNPVALIEFRRMIHEREKLCDDLAFNHTGKPLALAASLAKVFRIASAPGSDGKPASAFYHLELHSQRVRIEERVSRLMRRDGNDGPSYPHARLGLTALALLLLLFFVV